jgi:hypothetical protein
VNAAATPINGRRRGPHDTSPAPVPAGAEPLDGGELIDMIRDAVERGIKRATATAAPPMEARVDTKDKVLMVLAYAALAAVVGLSVALAFTLWGPG